MSFCKRVCILFLCTLLVACSEKLWVVKPIDVSVPHQKVSAQFKVREYGGYKFSLMFVWGDSMSERDKQRELWEGQGTGVLIPIHLRILKGRNVFFDETVVTTGIHEFQSFDYEGQTKSVAVRIIKGFGLEPGSYSVEVETLEPVDVLKSAETYVGFSYVNQKI
ncbi:DUF5625 family protein [Pseudomonas sp. FEN]|uniref:DUF5625 family protein n=1 Tax=Pseudomonas sp. FEN TaxID=2767468 RepID=UPI00174AA649|nr:DUF5625 family protein [Pseudomonas sp. FEN]